MNGTKKPQSSLIVLFFWFAMIFMMISIVGSMTGKAPPSGSVQKLSFKDFIAKIEANEVMEVTVKNEEEIEGLLKPVTKDATPQKFSTIGNTQAELYLNVMKKNDIVPTYLAKEKPGLLGTIFGFLIGPLLMLAVLMFVMRRNSPGGMAQMANAQTQLFDESKERVLFTDVAGCDEAKDELVEIVEFLRSPEKFSALGGKVPKGVLLSGPSGTGKTLLAKAVAGEAGVPFLSTSGSAFVEMFVGLGASRVRNLFEQAKKRAPCIIFLDEIDAVGKARGNSAGISGGNDEREQTLNQLLVEMDGFGGNTGIIIIAATNRPDVLDAALLRPGRFDRQVQVPLPDVKGREMILKVHAAKIKLADTVKLDVIAKGTPGLSGAELANLLNEAAIFAARKGQAAVEMRDIEQAKDKVIMGVERRSMVISEQQKKITAVHEAGHALVTMLKPDLLDPVHKVSIIPRGRALGITMSLPQENLLSLSRDEAEARICLLMGGRAAEELTFKHFTTGASNDLERATDLARNMVCSWGMSETFGPINLAPRLSAFGTPSEVMSPDTMAKIDAEIQAILKNSYTKTLEMLRSNVSLLEEITEMLLEKETIDSEDLEPMVQRLKV